MSFSTHAFLSNFGAGPLSVAGTGAAAVAAKIEAVVVDVGDLEEVSSVAFGREDEMVEEAADAAAAAGFAGPEGEEKKEVMEALAFGFLAVLVAISAALRLRGVAIVEGDFKANKLRYLVGEGKV